jgi:hypothetical protein
MFAGTLVSDRQRFTHLDLLTEADFTDGCVFNDDYHEYTCVMILFCFCQGLS